MRKRIFNFFKRFTRYPGYVGKPMFATTIMACLVLLAGCEIGARDKRVVKAEQEVVRRYEQSAANRAAIIDASLTSVQTAKNAHIAAALEEGAKCQAAIAKADPTKVADVIMEVERQHAVADVKRQAQADKLNAMRAVVLHDENTNLYQARELFKKINQYDSIPPVNLTASVQGILDGAGLQEPGK